MPPQKTRSRPPNRPLYAAALTISRTQGSGDNPRPIRIAIADELGVAHIEVHVSAKVFAEALLGLGAQPCTLEPRSADKLGYRREARTVSIPIPDDADPMDARDDERAARIDALRAAFDRDGWITRHDELTNYHRRTRTAQGIVANVTQVRVVPATPQEITDALVANFAREKNQC